MISQRKDTVLEMYSKRVALLKIPLEKTPWVLSLISFVFLTSTNYHSKNESKSLRPAMLLTENVSRRNRTAAVLTLVWVSREVNSR